MPSDKELLALSDLTQRDRIQILLTEYTALRAEYVARTGYGFQTAGFGLVAVGLFVQQTISIFFGDSSPTRGRVIVYLVAFMPVLVAFIIAIYLNLRDLSRVAARLQEIEREVNSRAGENLMVWETLGDTVNFTTYIRSHFTHVKTLARDRLEAPDPGFLMRDKEIKDPPLPVHAQLLEEAHGLGLLDGTKSEHVSFRAPPALLEAAKRETGVKSTTELGLLALAMLARPDPVARYMKRNRGKLGADHKLEY
jgi:hypothetical protein